MDIKRVQVKFKGTCTFCIIMDRHNTDFMTNEKYTPMIQQYLTVKESYPDTLLFYRVGDFYELFFEDAKIASKELDLVLTGKSAGVEEKVPMCGVPHHAYASYAQRLVQRGYKVAIVEQVQDPKEAQGIVERDVIRIITPGTLINEIIDEKTSVYLASIEDYRYGYSLALAEVSTGENFVLHCEHNFKSLLQALLSNNVKEVVLKKAFDTKVIQSLRDAEMILSYCEVEEIPSQYEPLVEALTKDYDRKAYGRMLAYIEETQRHALSHLEVTRLEKPEDVLHMDFNTQQNLELIEPLHAQTNNETLWTFLDDCKSAMGSRLLKKWIEKPLVQQDAIEMRYNRLQYFIDEFMMRQKMRDAMKNVYDLQRLIARCALNHANPIDCLRLSKTLQAVPEVLSCIDYETFASYRNIDTLEALSSSLKDAFVENPPALLTDGGVFQDGYSQELDEARRIQKDGRTFIAEMEAREREKTGIKTLKIGYNKVFGYYIEISKAAAAQVKEEWGYIRKQTLVNNERFISPELKEKEDAILHAEENAIRIEKQLFQTILDEVKENLPKLQKLSSALAELDCYQALAEVSANYGYVRPNFTDDTLEIIGGKHPILDVMMKEPHYVANDIVMDKDRSILLITGPNMGGKSTYMRQTALIVILAQMGCYVPAKSCKMPLFDKIFTRIGASDDILSGQSTFMVEMNEANQALSLASEKSLILFDEIGRGTSTYDGMALAQAMIEYIATCVHAKTIFSTHYHELTVLADNIPCVHNVHVLVHEDKEQVTFLYKVKEGSADRSYGINVARLANLPDPVIDRAKELQKELESKKRVVQQNFQLIEMERKDPTQDQIEHTLTNLSIDDISPREAWQMLADLSETAKKGK